MKYPIEVIKGNIPSKSNSYRIVVNKVKFKLTFKYIGRLVKSAQMQAYEKAFILQCKKYRNMNIQGELRFECNVYYDSKRPDLDGSFKAVLDCLQKVNAFKNDNKVIEISARKFKDQANPRIEFRITPLKDWDYNGHVL